jgi:phage baseplate assembly protein gpV
MSGTSLTAGMAGALSPNSPIYLDIDGCTLYSSTDNTIAGISNGSADSSSSQVSSAIINVSAGTLTISLNDANYTYSGDLEGSGGIFVEGTGSLTLNGGGSLAGGVTSTANVTVGGTYMESSTSEESSVSEP